MNGRRGPVLLPTTRATDGTKGGPNQRGSSGDLMLPSAVHLLPTPAVADTQGGRKHRSGSRSGELLLNGLAAVDQWGIYADAIARHEQAFGRSAPEPTMPGRKANRVLSPRFSEWMMGLPEGWVTDVPGITRNQALKALGNGVVPAQAAEAVRRVLAMHVGAAFNELAPDQPALLPTPNARDWKGSQASSPEQWAEMKAAWDKPGGPSGSGNLPTAVTVEFHDSGRGRSA